MVTDIAERRRTQQRVADGVDESVAVRVADGTFVERNLNAAQNQFPAADEAMHIGSDANAERILNGEW
jgi:hypothetical protein